MQDVGSTTTIVVEMLKAANVHITDAEATLFAIGIHADTGMSRYKSLS
jgi:nanoRNase/pAp phosphatase (c-di-AMP/oligoRNAs hydrolase)